MAKHTPGLVEAKLFDDPQWMVVQKGTEWGMICTTCHGNDEANARHIADCWNRCEATNLKASGELLRVSKLILERLDREAELRLGMDGKLVRVRANCYQYRDDLRKAIFEEEVCCG